MFAYLLQMGSWTQRSQEVYGCHVLYPPCGCLPPADEQLDAAYQEVRDVVTIGRGIGLWGDMLVTLKNGDKIEMRAIPK